MRETADKAKTTARVANRTMKKIAQMLDRRGGRRLLGNLTTQVARSLTGDPHISVMYDDMWVDVVDGKYLPRFANFNYSASVLENAPPRRGATCWVA